MRQSHTAVIERNVWWEGAFATEPYEAAWASEALFFVRTLESRGPEGGMTARVQISPDGMVWCDEGTRMTLPAAPGLDFCRVRHFGGWLRLCGELPPESSLRVIVYLVLKA
ncbi:MAG: hypothetical protein QN168_14375 [Armatimonadota bacterium]|nr:hypothetical protein [Armatimonadota bacterium]